MPTEMQTHVCRQDKPGQQKYGKLVEGGINKTEVRVWARMKKAQLKMWNFVRKAVDLRLTDQVLELDDRSA